MIFVKIVMLWLKNTFPLHKNFLEIINLNQNPFNPIHPNVTKKSSSNPFAFGFKSNLQTHSHKLGGKEND